MTVSVSETENIPDGRYVRVTIVGNDNEFSVTNSDDKLTYTVTGKQHYNSNDTDSQWEIETGAEVVHARSDDSDTPSETTLTFNAPTAEPKYAGDYTGTVTFNVSIS